MTFDPSVHAGFPVQAPGAGGLHAAWYEANAAAGCLTAQQCADCGAWRQPARHRCAACLSPQWAFRPVSSTATITSWTTTHRPFHFGFADVVPYSIVIAEVAEGVRFLLHVRPATAALTGGDPAAIVGTSVAVGVDEFGLPFAVIGSA